MIASISASVISKLSPKNKPYDVRDERLTGFILRVNCSGSMMYMCEYARGKRITIGKVDVLSPAQARDRAKEILADAVRGIELHNKKPQKVSTFASYIENNYQAWMELNRKSGKGSIGRIKTQFLKILGDKPLSQVTPWLVEQWRTRRLKEGIKPSTVNRDLLALKSALSKAIEWGLIDTHPLAKLKLSKVDTHSKVRYLSREEENRLREALDKREEKIKLARDRGNLWRQERGYAAMKDLQAQIFADHMRPMILLSLNTGLRQGELFSLTWKDFNFKQALLTIAGESSKSGKTRHIPLNVEALDVLQVWHQQTKGEGLIFSSKNNQRFNNVKTAWKNILKEAQIDSFRWHDMRHHFASSLVMAGVDLNTVRELLGHSDITMTLRYAHLAPEHKANAVAKLVQGRVIK
jgi:integrase